MRKSKEYTVYRVYAEYKDGTDSRMQFKSYKEAEAEFDKMMAESLATGCIYCTLKKAQVINEYGDEWGSREICGFEVDANNELIEW